MTLEAWRRLIVDAVVRAESGDYCRLDGLARTLAAFDQSEGVLILGLATECGETRGRAAAASDEATRPPVHL